MPSPNGPKQTPNWRTRIVREAEVPPGELLANPLNWRRHPERQRRALRGVLDEIGWVQRLIVNERSGHVIDGHARLEEALARGEPAVPALFVDLTLDEESVILAALDPIGVMADADGRALGELLSTLTVESVDLSALLADLARAHAVPLTRGDPDSIPDLPEPAATYVRPGDLWRLGEHRLLCGDALDPDAVARLLVGEAPALLATDPPYGVSLDLARRHDLEGRRRGAGRGAGHRNTTLAGDSRADWSEAYALVPSLRVAYVWRPALFASAVFAGLERLGFELVSELVWVKPKFAVGPRWYHWSHESCVVARRGRPGPFLGPRDQGTVIEAPSPRMRGAGADPMVDHPAQKPTVLFERPIRNHLHPGEVVYDPFLGSGTTLVAAETTRRRCYGLEIEPRFAQVAIERWQAVAGHPAELLDRAP